MHIRVGVSNTRNASLRCFLFSTNFTFKPKYAKIKAYKTIIVFVAGLSGFFGLFIIPLLIFALIFFILAIVITVVPQDKKGIKEYTCLDCKYQWKKEKDKKVS